MSSALWSYSEGFTFVFSKAYSEGPFAEMALANFDNEPETHSRLLFIQTRYSASYRVSDRRPIVLHPLAISSMDENDSYSEDPDLKTSERFTLVK